MKGNIKVIEALNNLIPAETAAILQYVFHSSVLSNWGYDKFASYLLGRAKDEMRHLDLLTDRIMFLEGTPAISNVAAINTSIEVPKQLSNDHTSELTAIEDYNNAIELCRELKDDDTRELLESILKDETKHLDEIENKQNQISQMTLPLFMTTQI